MSSSSKRNGSRETERAAGAFVWRENGKHLEVLLVHRPRYDDWSIPKGKVDPCESVRTCAVREVAEETGVQIILGQPLSRVRYTIGSGARKEVHYWAARVAPDSSAAVAARAAVTPASAKEIDAVEWLRVGQARKRLTYSYDRNLLGELVDLWEDGKLDTWTLVLVRHARAVKRSVWNRPKKRTAEQDEATRPLTGDHGRARARALAPILAAYGVGRAISSPWKRCCDTMAPYCRAAGLDLELEPAITEHAAAAAPIVERILNDERGWPTAQNTSFEPVADPAAADFTFNIATPPSADALCAPLDTSGMWSCRNATNVVINSDRWNWGAITHPDVDSYRTYVTNHEVGHFLGHEHEFCAGAGLKAPLMAQQRRWRQC